MRLRVLKKSMSYASKRYQVGEEFETRTERDGKILLLARAVEQVPARSIEKAPAKVAETATKATPPSKTDAFERALAAKSAPAPSKKPAPRASAGKRGPVQASGAPEQEAVPAPAGEPAAKEDETPQPSSASIDDDEAAKEAESNKYARRDLRAED